MTTAGDFNQTHGYVGVQKKTGLLENIQFPSLGQVSAKINERLDELTRDFRLLADVLNNELGRMQIRETGVFVATVDTNSAPVTNTDGQLFDLVKLLGCPANSLRVQSVGGGNFQVSVNDSDWVPVAASDTAPHFNNTTINRIRARVTSGGAGTGRIVLGYYSGAGSVKRA